MKDYLMDVLMIPTQQTEFLAEIPSLINLGFRFCWYCKIYEFFRDEQSLQSLHAETIESQCNILDDYMNTLVTEINFHIFRLLNFYNLLVLLVHLPDFCFNCAIHVLYSNMW